MTSSSQPVGTAFANWDHKLCSQNSPGWSVFNKQLPNKFCILHQQNISFSFCIHFQETFTYYCLFPPDKTCPTKYTSNVFMYLWNQVFGISVASWKKRAYANLKAQQTHSLTDIYSANSSTAVSLMLFTMFYFIL